MFVEYAGGTSSPSMTTLLVVTPVNGRGETSEEAFVDGGSLWRELLTAFTLLVGREERLSVA